MSVKLYPESYQETANVKNVLNDSDKNLDRKVNTLTKSPSLKVNLKDDQCSNNYKQSEIYETSSISRDDEIYADGVNNFKRNSSNKNGGCVEQLEKIPFLKRKR